MRNVGRSARILLATALALGLALPSTAWAQAAKAKKKAAAPEAEVEEITVTAEKREENVQEIPLSVTALSGEALEEKNVTTVTDLGQTAPNVRIVANPASAASTTISMRGLTQGDPNAALDPAVGLYIDGVYISKIIGSNFDLEDLERVEVLRGPQGTLYGRNTVGGAVNLITAKPTDEQSITLKTEAGNYDAFGSRVTLNTPLVGENGLCQSDAFGTVNLRQNVGYKSHDGFYRNSTGEGTSEFDDLNRIFTTTALRWEPSKDVTIDYSFEYHRYRDAPPAYQLTYLYPNSLGTFPMLPDGQGGFVPNPVYMTPYIQGNRSDSIANNALYRRDLTKLRRQADDGHHRMHIVSGGWDLGELGPLGQVTVKSISSYRNFMYQADPDLDGTPAHIAEFSQKNNVQHWSEELQWIGTADRIHYVAGFYYFGEHAAQNEDQVILADFPLYTSNLPYKNIMKTKSYAPYGQATWTPPILDDKLSLTAGIRYTQEQVHMTHLWYSFSDPTSAFTAARGEAFGGGDGISPMGDISYQWTDDLMTYFRVSRGFRAGGFTPTAPNINLFNSFKPETLLAYEAGIKSQWLDNRVRANANGFFSSYDDFQVSVFHPSVRYGAFSQQTNAARAEIWGTEFEAGVAPVRGVDASVSYSFLSPEYQRWIDSVIDDNGNVVGYEDVTNQRTFAHTPRHQVNVGLTYTAPATDTGVFSAHVNTYWQDEVAFIANNQTLGAQANAGWAYALVNGRLQFAEIPFQEGTLDLALFGRNIFDRKYRSYGIDFGSGLGYSGNLYGNPRTFGLQMVYKYKAS